MKTKKSYILFSILILVIGLGHLWGTVAFAAEDSCQVSSKDQAVPEKFSVGDCLTTDGQKGSRFVPTKDGDPLPPSAEGPKSNPNQVLDFAVNVIDVFVKIVATVALLVFIAGAIMAIASEGKSDRLERGKNAMVYALIGLAVAFFSFLIITFVQSIFFA